MKTKLLVALITCLALAACSKSESGKDEKKAGEGTSATQPAQNPGSPQGTIEAPTTLAAENAPAQDATSNPADSEKKAEELQDASNISSQLQSGDASINAAADKVETHTHED